MSNFCPDQGRTRVYGEAYSLYAAAENPRRTQIRAKRAIYGWKLDSKSSIFQYQGVLSQRRNLQPVVSSEQDGNFF